MLIFLLAYPGPNLGSKPEKAGKTGRTVPLFR
jgi:hypothetical protein